jgi:trypsin
MISRRPTRVVEILSTNDKMSYGSGYLLGGGLVLTARHVLLPRGERVPEALNVVVRTVDMARRNQEPISASLVWPRNKGAEYACDIALIRLASTWLGPPTLWLGRNAEPIEQPPPSGVHVQAIGFPRFAKTQSDGRDTWQISGAVNLGTGEVSDTLAISDLEYTRKFQGHRVSDRKRLAWLLWRCVVRRTCSDGSIFICNPDRGSGCA